MKRLFYVVVTVFACVAAYQAMGQNVRNVSGRDWNREVGLMANDLPGLLHYHPTDGASYAGKIRQSMDPSHVHP